MATKEEILTKHTGWLRVRTGEANLSDVIDAIQEYAELYHKEKLREELIIFCEWLVKNGYGIYEEDIDIYLDENNEYLKSKP